MDNAQKAIMIGVGLFITIIIISAVLLVVNLGTGLVDDATSNLSSMSSSLQNQILQNYDAKVVSGTQVRGAIQQYMTATDLSIVLVNDDGNSVASVGARNLAGQANGADIQITIDPVDGTAEISSDHYTNSDDAATIAMTRFTDVNFAGITYVNTSARYNAYVIRVDGDAMVGVIFIPSDLVGTSDITVLPSA